MYIVYICIFIDIYIDIDKYSIYALVSTLYIMHINKLHMKHIYLLYNVHHV